MAGKRGPAQDDHIVFSPANVLTLRSAAEEVRWLQGRGYPTTVAVTAAGDHHQLTTKARLALTRGCCSDERAKAREGKRLDPSAMAGQRVLLDGFNAIISLEIALGGGVLLGCADGTLRDLAGLRGSYHLVDDTDRAIELLLASLRDNGAASSEWFLDAPVSNSGRLRQRIGEIAERDGGSVTVTMVQNADYSLVDCAFVVSADAVVIEQSRSWVNLARHVVDANVHNPWIVPLAA